MFAIPRSSNGPKPFYASPGVTTINISKNGISSKRMKNDFSQKFFWFDNIVPNQQNKWLGFSVEKKKLQLCTDTKVENFASCPKVACFLLPRSGGKRGHNDHRVAILESALFHRVLSPFSAKLPLMMIVWTCAFKQTYQRLAKLLTAYDQNNTEFSPRAALENDAANCNLLGLENQPKLFSSILHLISFY